MNREEIYLGNRDIPGKETRRTAEAISSGRIEAGSRNRTTVRKKGRQDYSLFFCKAGAVHLEKGRIMPGELYIYPPNVPQYYRILQEEKTVYYYLHFVGSDIPALLRELNIPCDSPVKTDSVWTEEALKTVGENLRSPSPLRQLDSECLILRLFAKLGKGREIPITSPDFSPVTDRMEHSLQEPYSAEDYASLLHLGVDRFNHLFRETMGISPYGYLLRLRMENARELLTHTDLKVREVGDLCGFRDPLYFAQAFRKHSGLSPSAFRKKHGK